MLATPTGGLAPPLTEILDPPLKCTLVFRVHYDLLPYMVMPSNNLWDFRKF